MDELLVASIVCFAIAFIMIAVDVFVPSGGLLTAGSFIVALVAVVLLWQVDSFAATIVMIIIAFVIPLTIFLLMRHFDHLPMFRKFMLDAVSGGGADSGSDAPSSGAVGKTGKAVSDLRPVGTCVIDGKRIECLAETGVIEAGAEVEVISDNGFEIKVRER